MSALDRTKPAPDYLRPMDIISLEMMGLDNKPCQRVQIEEGWPGTGAMLVKSYADLEAKYKPVWKVQRMVDGTVHVRGELSEAGRAVRDLLASDAWMVMSRAVGTMNATVEPQTERQIQFAQKRLKDAA